MVDRASIKASKEIAYRHREDGYEGLLHSQWIRLGFDSKLYPFYVTAFNGKGFRGRRYE